MTDKGKYSVSNLSGETGVPRTTINDWLQRFAQYLSFETQGKRKLYSQRTLDILLEVNSLRNEGKNIIEIEEILAGRHPIKPEIAEEGELGKFDSSEQDDRNDEEMQAEQNRDGQEFAVIARKQTDEIARLISEQLSTLAGRIGELEDINRNNARANNRWMMFCVIIVLIFLAGGVMLFMQYRSEVNNNIKLNGINRQTSAELEAEKKALSERDRHIQVLNGTLSQSRQEFSRNVDNIKKEFSQEKNKLKDQLEQQQLERQQAHQKELEDIRNKFAAERLDLMKKLENLNSGNMEKSEIIRKLQQQSVDLSESLRKLSDRYAEAKEAQPAPAESKAEPAEKAEILKK